MWTLYACGLNPQSFSSTEAAIVQNTYGNVDDFPKMIWSTNYYRLAAATMFTLFFGGRDFAPKCIIDGMNIQDYLQGHYLDAIAHLARRIREAGDLESSVVFGWESLNEPNKGIIGYQDISVIPKEQALKKGTSPTIWQAMLTGMGRAVEVDTWEMGGLGPVKSGRTLVDPHGEIAWLPAGYDDSRYGYKRDPGWRLGEYLWAQHGVWDPATDELLRKDYFAKNPRTGETVDYPCFSDTYFMEHYRRYRDVVRTHHPDAILLLQGPTMELPPQIKGTADDDPRMVYAPHFYDGITLMTKKWNRKWNVDVLGVLRGHYWSPVFAIRVGETAIRNCFREQLAAIRQEGLDRMGNHPCVLTEFGIPYDMDDKHAYKTGDYSSQSAAMDANHFAVEGARMEGYTLWLYMTQNDHQRGDQWNGEDLSIISLDDALLPVSQLPKPSAAAMALKRVVTAASNAGSASPPQPPAAAVSLSPAQAAPRKSDVDQDDLVTPANLKRMLTQPSISSRPNSGSGSGNNNNNANARQAPSSPALSSPELTTAPGLRAAEAYVRPAPVAVAGEVVDYGFDLHRCEFSLKVWAETDEKRLAVARMELSSSGGDGSDGSDTLGAWPPLVGVDPETLIKRKALDSSASGLEDDDNDDNDNGLLPVPTVVWLPEFHFPEESVEVEVSGGGRWEIAWDEEEAVLLQRLRWWHGRGEQTLKVRGLVRKHNYVEGVSGEDGYYDQLSNWIGSGCSVM